MRERKFHVREHFLDYAIDEYGRELVDDTKCLLNILVLFLPLPVFWSLFDQQGSRWMFQADKMNLNLGFYKMPTELISILNPLLILAFIPLFDFVVYPFLRKFDFGNSLEKMTVGGLFAAIAFVLTAFVQWKIENSPEKSVSIFWQVPQYVVMTMAEILFSIPGLTFSYENAPNRMKSVVQSFWLLTVSFGDVIIIGIGNIHFASRVYDFLLFAGIMILDMFLFMYIAHRYQSKTVSKRI